MSDLLIQAIVNQDLDAIHQVAQTYHQRGEYELMKIFYNLAIDKQDLSAMNKMAEFYRNQGDFESAQKYQKMVTVSDFYHQALNNPEKAKELLLLGSMQGCTKCMFKLGLMNEYHNANYFKMALDKGHIESIFYYAKHQFMINEYENAERYLIKYMLSMLNCKNLLKYYNTNDYHEGTFHGWLNKIFKKIGIYEIMQKLKNYEVIEYFFDPNRFTYYEEYGLFIFHNHSLFEELFYKYNNKTFILLNTYLQCKLIQISKQ